MGSAADDHGPVGTPIVPQGDGELVYTAMRPEEFNRAAVPFLGASGERTPYMSAEEREKYRLSVNDKGLLVDADGNLYSTSEGAKGHYPGSTGGDIFVLDQGGRRAGPTIGSRRREAHWPYAVGGYTGRRD